MPVDRTSQPCPEETALADEFPSLYSFLSGNRHRRPQSCEIWERFLRLARHSRPILDKARARGLDLVLLDQYTPPETDRSPLYESILEELPSIKDALTLSVSLSRLHEPEARSLLKRSRELLLHRARECNGSVGSDAVRAQCILAQCITKVILDRNVPEIVRWARDWTLDVHVRWSYASGLQRFARRPGPAREALLDLLQDAAVGGAAIWALAGAMEGEALPILRALRESTPDDRLRQIATAAAKRIEARSRKSNLPVTSPDRLPPGYRSTTIELDTDLVPGVLARLQEELERSLPAEIAARLALSASQLRRGRGRFHIVTFAMANGEFVPFGVGFYAEEDDVSVVELHYDPQWHSLVAKALQRSLDADQC